MKMNKLKDFTKKYGFYLAVGIVSIGAVTAVVLTSDYTDQPSVEVDAPIDTQGDATSDYTQGESDTVEAMVPIDGVPVPQGSNTGEPIVPTEVADTEVPDLQIVTSDTDADVTDMADELVSETFSTTTAESSTMPFFAEGDTLAWPVEGQVVVPYTDDTTVHWESPALKETMRTYGICIASEEGTSIQAPARGTVIDIVDESKNIDTMKYAGNLGKVMMIDLGNGYTVNIGLQGGAVDEALLGQVVEVGQTIGTVGTSVGPYAGMAPSVYMQVTQSGNTVDPTSILSYQEEVAEAVDMGHAAE